MEHFIESHMEEYLFESYPLVVEGYAKVFPEKIYSSDWYDEDHFDEFYDYLDTYCRNDILNWFLENKVFILPEYAELYNNLIDNETYISESNDTLSIQSRYMSKCYEIKAIKIQNFFVVISIYNKDDCHECIL